MRQHQLLHVKRLVLHDDIEHCDTPTRNNRHENFENTNEEETKKLTFLLYCLKNKKLTVRITERVWGKVF